jgi:hypothetical protein
VIVLALLAALAACSGNGGRASSTSTSTTASTATTAPPYEVVVDTLAADAMGGRDNQTPASTKAQDYLIGRLRPIARPLGGDYRHPFSQGTNLLAVIPGTDLRDQYVVLGAHYDHLGRHCRDSGPADSICNGATDNAAGVAAVLEIGRRLAAGPKPRRSVVLAFWDAEEDGLLGSRAYVTDPGVPLAATAAYLNWDIQGADLFPSLACTTFAIGAETGGAALTEATKQAATAADLQTVLLSLVFAQGRSDHAVFAGAGVPTVAFSDSTAGCYHTVHDEASVVDVAKLGEQIRIGEALARDLASSDRRPAFQRDLPAATYADAQGLRDAFRRAQPDFAAHPEVATTGATLLRDLEGVVARGEGAFDGAAVATVLRAASTAVDTLTTLPCEPARR